MLIARKMGLGFGVLLALTATLAVVVLFNLANMNRQSAAIIEHHAVNTNARELLKLVVDMETGQRGFVITGQNDFLAPYTDAIADFSSLLATVKTLVGDRPAQVARLNKIEETLDEWKEKAARPEIEARRNMGEDLASFNDVADLLIAKTGKKLLDQMRDDFAVFIEEEESLTAARFESAAQASRNTTTTTILLALVSLAFGAVVATRITRGITKPVGNLSDALGRVASGNLNQQIESDAKDEIGTLSRSFNQMVLQLSEYRDEQARTALDLAKAKNSADFASQAKSDFLANMSHEIRTPMTAIVGFSENMLDQNQTPSDRLNCVHTIRRNGAHLLELIDDILDLSKIEAGKMAIERQACSPCKVIADVASLMRVRSDAKGLPLQIEYEGPIPETIQCDPTRLRQILINLIGNAIKFTETGSITLLTRIVSDSNEAFIEFDVIDTGCGLTDDQIMGLFHPFAQADTSTTRRYGGTGLGLTISKRFAKAFGGDITIVKTAVGAGTTFRATIAAGPFDQLKLLDDPIRATTVDHSGDRSALTNQTDLRSVRILLAEDGPDNQRLISFMLKQAGADVTLAENGKIAYDEAMAAHEAEKPFEVILMDMQMPVLDGYAATRLLREAGYEGSIIAMTANAMDGDRKRCIDAGCSDYASKPIDRPNLLKKIEQHAHQQ